tara:strand:- start:3860 stop:4069 length:210 start_codon:yes stop_codon:yes gene_type:complete
MAGVQYQALPELEPDGKLFKTVKNTNDLAENYAKMEKIMTAQNAIFRRHGAIDERNGAAGLVHSNFPLQ